MNKFVVSPKRSFVCGFLLALFCAGIFVVVPVLFGDVPETFAQALTGDELFGGKGAKGTTFAQEIGLSAGPSIQVMIARIIRTVIGFVGIIVVVMIIYGGFLYMTAGGNATRLEKAKKILTQAIIGLVIVLTSFTIVHFIVGKLVEAAGGITSEEKQPPTDYSDDDKKFFKLSSDNTECAKTLRNFQLQIVFTDSVNPMTVQNGIVVQKAPEVGGGLVKGTFEVSGNLVTFTPLDACDPPNAAAKCFEKNTPYRVAIDAGVLKSTTGKALSCTAGLKPCVFGFTTGEGIDLTGPTLSMTAPTDGKSVLVGDIELLQAKTQDDTGVSSVKFYVIDEDSPLFISGLDLSANKKLTGNNTANAFSTDTEKEWNTAGYVTNKAYPIWASASDCAGNTASAAKISAVVRAANCGNDIKDVDLGETDIDCGGDPASEFYCGKCDGEEAGNPDECASGVVENGKCVTKPRIDLVSPSEGAFGNLITIFGAGFGDAAGTVTFFDKGKTVGFKVGPYACQNEPQWSKKEIIVQVPFEATDGPIEVATAGPDEKTDRTDDAYGPLSPDFDVNAIKRPGLCASDPKKAKPGTEVSFFGLGFGQKKGSSTVYFKDFVSLAYPAWSDLQIKAVVPNMEAGKNQSVQVFTGDYRCIDATGKEIGKVCAEDKDCGDGNTCAKSWCSETLTYCASDAGCKDAGGYCASVRVGSNKIKFDVDEVTSETAAPVISYVDSGWKACEGGATNGKHCAKKEDCGDGECKPASNWGPIGQYVTIYGTGFGSQKDKVFFQGSLGNDALADTNFPDQCGDQFWTDSAITIKVPEKYQAGDKKLTFDTHKLYVKKGEKTSNTVDFVVLNDSPGPAICKLDPVAGPSSSNVIVYGENLGGTNGAVTFYDQQKANYLFWEQTKVTDAVVPLLAKTGPVFAENQAGYTSNSLNFTVGNCQKDLSCPVGTQCCKSGACKKICDAPPPQAHFAYKVSTGLIPEAPVVIPKCDNDFKSPTPWEKWPDSKTVCRNAVVSATFSKQMNQLSFSGNVVVEQCAQVNQSGECTAWGKVNGNIAQLSEKAFNWLPSDPKGFVADKLHRVTIIGGQGGVQANEKEGGAFMVENYSWQFLTAGEDAYCTVGGVNVTPHEFTAVEQKQSIGYIAQLVAKGYQCVTISCAKQNIDWFSNFPGAKVQQPTTGDGLCQQSVEALEETQGNPAKIYAQVTNVNPSPVDFGKLTINFSDPTVAAFFPSCSTSCVNAKPWARFQTEMDPDSFGQAVTLYECQNALCAQGQIVETGLIQNVSYDPASKVMFVNFKANKQMKADKWYRVVLKGSLIKSKSKVALKDSGSNFGTDQNKEFPGDFSWKFKTKNSDLLCKIDSLSVTPNEKTLLTVGARQEYHAIAYNAPDDCDASGQALQDVAYKWEAWQSVDTPDTVPFAQGGSSNDVAFLLNAGSIELASNLPAWCSNSCLNIGTIITKDKALCGDGVVNGPGKKASEECEAGEGCSASCLWNGTGSCSGPGGVNCCGNNVVDKGEQCDDGGHVDGGGCSAICLNEGSQSIGAVCGDSVVDYVAQTGGEDCDDGNIKNGDGCSAQCLFEGSLPQGNFSAVCGNGGVPEPGEDCDDGNTENGDGCNSKCLNEGTLQCALVCSDTKQTCKINADCQVPATCGPAKTPCCGNGVLPEKGEDCDDGNIIFGDGCSAQCLKEGSSIHYAIATFCGDGKVQTGEECDATAGQTLKVGGFAAAQISPTVYKEVGPDGGYAVSTITASTEGVKGIATLKIDCSCETDQACGSPETIGCGAGSCCFPRPEATTFEPVGGGPGGQGFCRNTTVRVKFNQEMDPKSFEAVDKDQDGVIENEELANLRLELVTNDGKDSENDEKNCPDSYQFAQAPNQNQHFLVRLWQWIKSSVRSLFGQEAVAAGKYCVAPVSYKVQTVAGGQWVYLELDAPLEKNATYRIRVVGDTTFGNDVSEGVKSLQGVGAAFIKTSTFKTGTEVCLLEAVSVEDVEKIGAAPYEPPSPQFFSKVKEEHKFVSQALTYRDGLGVYEKISGTKIYDWAWEWGSSVAPGTKENIVDGASQENLKDTGEDANFVAVGNSGLEHVVSTAAVSVDTLNNPTTKGTENGTVAGTLEVTAMTCDNPWPAVDPLKGWKSYIEQEDPTKPSNFGFYYCRDRGSASLDDDLPALDKPVDVTSVAIKGLIQELLFKVKGTPDAIGVRVFQNDQYLSPKAWFEAQKFIGGYTEFVMDGYEGVQSGNTAYVAAANEHKSVIYPNIYVVSYNPNAGTDAKEIFDQILKNWRFNANTDVVSNVGLCKTAGGYVKNADGEYIGCKWDGQCAENDKASCDNEKAEIQKDMKRLTDITTQVSLLNAYGMKNKHCAVTKTQICSGDTDCPGKEKCMKGYPTIQKGTFVPALTVSKWGSWNAEYANELKTAMPVDPVNAFWLECKGKGANYDPATCFNGSEGKFICPDKSHVYGYQSQQGGEAYTLYAQLEYDGAPWKYQLDALDDNATIIAEYAGGKNLQGQPLGFVPNILAGTSQLCKETVWGDSQICGDGVIGAGEDCEPGQVKALGCVEAGKPTYCSKSKQQCQTDANCPANEKCVNGFVNVACKKDCKYQSVAEAKTDGAACVPYQCGNGVLEAGEMCDDGTLNGTYGHCGAFCTFADAVLCGDGYLAGGEQCDCGTVANYQTVKNKVGSWANQHENDTCRVANGQYGQIKGGFWGIVTVNFASCSYDCKMPGPFCGDKEINGTETCDGGAETWAGKICSNSPTPCQTNSDCSNNGVCGVGAGAGVCPTSQICVGGNTPGISCSNNAQCGANSLCSPSSYPLSRTRTCSNVCSWDPWSVCKGGEQQCGNGKKEGTEACDDGNQANDDSCTKECKLNVCGDGNLWKGVESCDSGDQNVLPDAPNPCTAQYGSTCNYCNTLCQYKTYSGAYCGDGVINGTEYCDSTAMPKWCTKVTGSEVVKMKTCQTNANCDAGFECQNPGVCNGGVRNGLDCLANAQCSGGTCVTPTCAKDCSASCPFTFKTTSILVQSEMPDAQPLQSIDLYKYLNKEGLSPDSAVLHLPACRVGTKISANIDNTNVQEPNVDVVFVTDLSGSMNSKAGSGKTRIQVVSEATVDAIDKLFSAYAGSSGQMRIGLVSYEGNTAKIDSSLLTKEGVNKQTLKSLAAAYPTKLGGGTPTALGIKKGIEVLSASPINHVKILILLSDGEPGIALNGNGCATGAFQTESGSNTFSNESYCTAEARYADGMIKKTMEADSQFFFYSAAVTSGDALKAYMEHMSSLKCIGTTMSSLNDCDNEGAYAFSGNTPTDIKGMYDAIVQSILSSKTTVTATKDGTVQSATGITPVGNNVSIPVPSTFQCKDTPFTMPIKTSFYGTGSMKFDNFTFTYCPIE